MGYQHDQRLPSEREGLEELLQDPVPSYRPPLPPRDTDLLRVQTLPWLQQDPRNASTESLVPATAAGGRRELLIVYIHGFLGDETSFQSFPAHVHNVITALVSQTHVVHTKIYPKYRSRKHIVHARDNFSIWLEPHESPTTDIILCGHSMGGLLSAEVALKPQVPSGDRLQHRILGTMNFDVPFLGMHPGVIISGLSSVFQPAQKSPELNPLPSGEGSTASIAPSASASFSRTDSNSAMMPLDSSSSNVGSEEQRRQSSSYASTLNGPASPLSIPEHDPNYNPPYYNDMRLAARKGWEGPLHFVKKHSNELFKASRTYITSHLEFGGAMADYQGLKARYKSLRSLEDIDDRRSPNRVRFVNFYTASTGRPKSPKMVPATENLAVPEPSERRLSESSKSSTESLIESPGAKNNLENTSRPSAHVDGSIAGTDAKSSEQNHSASLSDRRSSEVGIESLTISRPDSAESETLQLFMSPPIPEPMEEEQPLDEGQPLEDERPSVVQEQHPDENLPQIPDEPIPPEPFDPSRYEDKDSRRLAEKDYDRHRKVYRQAVKDRENALKDRQKLLEKRQKKRQKDEEKAKKDEEKAKKEEKKRVEKEERDRVKKEKETPKPAPVDAAVSRTTTESVSDAHTEPEVQTADLDDSSAVPKKKRDKKFCVLPPRLYDGEKDPTWIRVFMKDVDEVGAHCGVFFTTYPHYEQLVQQAGEKMAEWVEHAGEVRRRSSEARG